MPGPGSASGRPLELRPGGWYLRHPGDKCTALLAFSIWSYWQALREAKK